MTSTFSLEGALSSAAVPSKRNEFLRYVLETQHPGVHDDDGSRLSTHSTATVLETEMFNAAGGHAYDLPHSHSQCLECLEYLCRNGRDFLTENRQSDKETICGALLNMADDVKVLPPADDSLISWDVFDMTMWKDSLSELIKELKTVEEMCPSILCDAGIYVLTTSPYAGFLRALATEIADGTVKFNKLSISHCNSCGYFITSVD